MDSELKQLEDALKTLTPKEPSEGARWNLASRLDELEDARKPRFPFPRFTVISSAAAMVLLVTLIWVLATREVAPPIREEVVKEPAPAAEDAQERPVVKVEPETLRPAGRLEFVQDEEDYPSTVAFEIERHSTTEEDLGIVRIADQPPMRKIRRNYVSELLLTDPKTGKTYRAQMPKSETILIHLDNE